MARRPRNEAVEALLTARAAHASAIASIDLALAALDAAYSRPASGTSSTVHSAVHSAVRTDCPVVSDAVDNALDSLSSEVDSVLDSRTGQPFLPRASSSEISSSLKHSEDLEKNSEKIPEKKQQRAREMDSLSSAMDSRMDNGLDSGMDSRNGQPSQSIDDDGKRERMRAVELAGCWDGVGGISTGGSMRARIRTCIPLLERLAAERKRDPVELFGEACKRFRADPKVRAKRYGLPVLLSQLDVWVDAVPAEPARGSMAPVSAVHDVGEVDVRAFLEQLEAAQ